MEQVAQQEKEGKTNYLQENVGAGQAHAEGQVREKRILLHLKTIPSNGHVSGPKVQGGPQEVDGSSGYQLGIRGPWKEGVEYPCARKREENSKVYDQGHSEGQDFHPLPEGILLSRWRWE